MDKLESLTIIGTISFTIIFFVGTKILLKESLGFSTVMGILSIMIFVVVGLKMIAKRRLNEFKR